MDESLYALTGMPNTSVSHSSKTVDQLWSMLSSWDKKNYIMTSAVFCDGTDKKGLVCGHAYTTLGVATYNNQRLVLVRNPWGSERYTGPWSDSSAELTDAAKQALGHSSANDGKFFVPMELYHSLFGTTVTAFYDDWKVSTKQTSWDRVASAYTMSWNVSNKDQQNVSVGLVGAYRRDMKDKTCSAPARVDNLAFSLRNLSTGAYVTDQSGRSYNWLTYWNGNSWLNFNNLPAGNYRIQIRCGSPTTQGNMPFTVQTFGKTSAVSFA